MKAKPRIRKEQVIVWNQNVTYPQAARYAWANNSRAANLISGSGLPAAHLKLEICINQTMLEY